MAKITSGYTGGLNQDLAISKNDNKHIYNALDIDLITDLGESTAIISNHRGNSLQFRVPDVLRMFSITIDYTPPILNTNLTILTSGGPVVVPINLSALADSIDVYNQIIANPFIAAAIAAGEFGVYYNSQEVIIQSYSVLADPTSSTTSLVVTTEVANQRDLSIIGWCTLEEEIVLFTTSKYNTAVDPANTTPTAGQVWVLEYDDALDTVTNLLPANTLNPAVHLKYNNIINFSLHNEIYREALGRTESSLKGSVYWTDDYNRPRALNVYNPQCPAIPVGLLDWKPSVDMSTPIIDAVITGGLLLAGTYQVAYQLYSKDGAATIYSPASTLVPITDSSLLGPPYEYDGAPIGTPSGKSIRTTINHIDLRYDFIKVIFIEYESQDLAVINTVIDSPIDGESMSFTISGGENKVAITVEEFVNPLIFFDRCKTFTQKKNRLYPANTRTKKFEVNFDSRAYRFGELGSAISRICRLYSRDGSFADYDATIPAQLSALYSLPDSEDAVNAYNDESGQIYGLLIGQDYDDWLNNYQYKYKADGVTLGGQGPNIEYQFVYKQYRADDIYLDELAPSYPITDNPADSINGLKAYYQINAPFVEPLNINTTSVVENFGDPLTPLDGFDHPLTGWDSLKNPLYSTLFAGYARGEVYRFGMVFYNDKGEESFVKWISDIRIPEPWEGLTDPGNPDSAADLSYYDTTYNLNMEVRSMGVQFKINNLPADITGFRIVRVERQQKDKTRHGIGMTLGIMNGKIELTGSSGPVGNKMLYSFSNTDYDYFTGIKIPMFFVNNDFSLGEDNTTGTAPALHGPFDPVLGNLITRVNNLGIVKSPDIDFGNYVASDATYMKMLHAYEWPEYFYTGVTGPGPGGQTYLNSGVNYWSQIIIAASGPTVLDFPGGAFFIKARDVVNRGRNIITFSNQTLVDIEGIVTSNFSPAKMAGEDYHHIGTWDMPDVLGGVPPGGTISGWRLSGLCTKSIFCDFDGIPYNVDTPSGGSYINNPNSGTKDTYFRIVSLCSTNFGQYGGPWRSARYNNTYISASDFIPNNALVSGFPQYIKVFGGDVFVSFYNTTLSFFPWKETYGYDNANPSGLAANYESSDKMSAIAVAFPAEASLNLEYRDGKYWNKDQVFTSNTGDDSNPTIPGNNSYPLGSDFAKFLADEYTYNTAYSQQNNLKTYIPLPFNFNTDEDQPAWVWVSQPKFDREAIDSWRRYLVNDYLPLEAIYGPINKIINLKEMLLTYQTRGIAQVSSQESTALPDSGTGAVFQVGTGNVLARYDYLSKEFGAFHQHGVVTGPAAAYSFDIRNKKVFRVAQGLENMSDVKGLAAFFRNNLYGAILNTDTVLLNTGVHGVYDTKYNKVYFTFENKIFLSTIVGNPTIFANTITYAAGDWRLTFTSSSTDAVDINTIFKTLPTVIQVKVNDLLYDVSINVLQGALVLTFIGLTNVPTSLYRNVELLLSFTIAFNEMLQAFESFYSFKPTLYLPTGKRLLSANPYNINNSVYQHNDGNFGQFYDRTPSISEVEFIVNFPDATKVPTLRIDTLEFWTEVFDANGIDVPLETITGILLYNDYQSTGSSLTLLTPQSTVVRRERTWRINQLRDDVATYGVKSFLRDKYVKIKIFYNNQNNRYFRLNEFNTNVTLSYY